MTHGFFKSSNCDRCRYSYPDWVAVQRTGQGEVNWLIETKGRVWEDTAVKDAAMRDWCARISQQTGQRWEYARVNQADFEAYKLCTLAEATQMSGQESDNTATTGGSGSLAL